jgi:pectate lyase
VYAVTNLNNSGPGSIVDAVSVPGRTVVFRVSGTIEMGSTLLRPKSYITIAGQTAPGDGICIKGRIYISGVSDVIIRYLRVRVDEGGANSSGDAIDIASGNNIIIDHVSASYARDETISCQPGSNNVTVQWCILSEALTFENHSYGSLIRGRYGERKTYHHNLYAHNKGRNPRPGNYLSSAEDPDGLYFDFRNNVIYNWSGTHPGNNYDTGNISRYNFVNNVFIRGPGSSGTKIFGEYSIVSYGYFLGNAHGTSYATALVPSDPWSLVSFSGFTTAQLNAYKSRTGGLPIAMDAVTTTSAAQAKADVLSEAGASFPVRDIIDSRIVTDVINGTGRWIANTSEQPEGAWPTLYSAAAPADSDHDGMPDGWELVRGLNPYNPADRNYYTLHPDYTNLEVYLNGLLMGIPPAVDAGDDQVVWLGKSGTAGQETVYLDGLVIDDGIPVPCTTQWSQVANGSPEAVLTPVGSDDAMVTFSERGIYAFRLSADDGTGPVFDTVVVIVGEDSCDASHLETDAPYHAGDFNRDCIVNMTDLMEFLEQWLACTDTVTFCGSH